MIRRVLHKSLDCYFDAVHVHQHLCAFSKAQQPGMNLELLPLNFRVLDAQSSLIYAFPISLAYTWPESANEMGELGSWISRDS